MSPESLENLIENEREWRRYMIENIEGMKSEISAIKAWNLVFRLVGGFLVTGGFAIVIVILEKVIN